MGIPPQNLSSLAIIIKCRKTLSPALSPLDKSDVAGELIPNQLNTKSHVVGSEKSAEKS